MAATGADREKIEMGETSGPQPQRPGRIAMILSGVAFAAFVANAVAGKVSLLMGEYPPFHIGNVAELVLLVLAVGCFVVAVLEKERAQPRRSGTPES
jgi:hypothetical protein